MKPLPLPKTAKFLEHGRKLIFKIRKSPLGGRQTGEVLQCNRSEREGARDRASRYSEEPQQPRNVLLPQGDLVGAQPLYERALVICEKVLPLGGY